MSAHYERPRPSMMESLQNPGLEPVVAKHMRKVYTALGAATLASAAGCGLQMALGWNSPTLCFLVVLAALINFARLPARSPYRYWASCRAGLPRDSRWARWWASRWR